MLDRMIRSRMLVPALAVIALLVAAPAAPAASPANIDVEFDLPANSGLRAHVETHSEGIELEIESKDQAVEYEVPGEVTEAGLKAQFGKLGVIDVAFTPTRTRTFEPPKDCKGEPSTFSDGVFAGTIRFRGERGYVRIEATEAKGTMEISREPEWRCPGEDKPIRPPTVQSSSAPVSDERPKARREQGTLIAAKRGCTCFFAAYTAIDDNGNDWVAFVGVKFEKREGMEITRGAVAKARPDSFVFDHDAGTARVDPPQPFNGTATYKRRKGRDLWRSTLRVPLLGAPPLHVRGKGSVAALVRERLGGR
jgi:hypothetical protein